MATWKKERSPMLVLAMFERVWFDLIFSVWKQNKNNNNQNKGGTFKCHQCEATRKKRQNSGGDIRITSLLNPFLLLCSSIFWIHARERESAPAESTQFRNRFNMLWFEYHFHTYKLMEHTYSLNFKPFWCSIEKSHISKK